MGATTKLSFEEFRRLQETAEETFRYELDEGELLLTPSPAPRHNIVRYNLRHALTTFVKAHRMGLVLDETDFRLSENTVRKPDVAFIAQERMKNFDFDRSPIAGAPSLAIEIISPTNRTQDTTKKVRQYLAAGCHSVWLVFPSPRVVGIHHARGSHTLGPPQRLHAQTLFSGRTFSLSLKTIFGDDLP